MSGDLELVTVVDHVEPEIAYWVSDSGQVFGFAADGSQDSFKPDGVILRLMDEDEVYNHLNPKAITFTNGLVLFESFHMDDPKWWVASEEEIEEITSKMYTEAVLYEISMYRSVADSKIPPLQDAHDLGIISDEKYELLKQWKIYRIKLSEIVEQEGFPHQIEWPVQPT